MDEAFGFVSPDTERDLWRMYQRLRWGRVDGRTHMHTLRVAELLHPLHSVYKLGVWVHLMRPKLVHSKEPIQVGQLPPAVRIAT